MPTNKNSMIRYQTLDKCFSNLGRMYFIEDLMQACSDALEEYNYKDASISRRQIFEDIRFMRSEQGWNIPLDTIASGRRKYYRYAEKGFSINNSPLNENEWKTLREAMHLTSRVFGDGPFSGLDSIIKRNTLPLPSNSAFKQFLSFDENPYVVGLEHLPMLFNAISNSRVVQINYQPFGRAAIAFILHSLHLRQYQGRWFFFGYDSQHASIANLAVDRIESITETNEKYDTSGMEIFDGWFDDIIGVTKPTDSQPIRIILSFKASAVPYILTKPLHGSQKKVEQSDSSIVISIQVIPNFELDKLILGFGELVTVLEPLSYRDHIRDKISALMANYE
jgi:predicted DNA-binding transcriptional regulator YafY